MRNTVLGLLLLVLTISCYRKIPTATQRNIPTQININALKSENISEEITGNDEIHWMIWLINDSTTSPYVQQERHDALSFYKEDLIMPKKILFKESFSNPDNLSLIIVLVELDTEKPLEERISLVRKQLQWANYQPHDSLQSRIYQTLLDDDLLGISFYKLSSLNPEGQFLFTGVHLFDKYLYKMKYELK